MIIIPAIDVKDGKCVRLLQGQTDKVTIYSDDPVEMAKKWEACGAELLHVVDLDGAVEGTPKNIVTVERIIKAVRIPVEVGGGIRNLKGIETYIKIGAEKIVLGTSIVWESEFVKEACNRFPKKIIAGIDTKDGMVAIRGWKEVTGEKGIDLAKRVEQIGVTDIICTDISRDGMLSGANIGWINEMAEAVDIPVIASGGVSKLDDIRDLLKITKVKGVIIGKAIYSGNVDLREAIALTKT